MTILVPLDGAKLTEAVLPCVEGLASRLRAEVYFVRVIDASPLLAAGGVDDHRGAAAGG